MKAIKDIVIVGAGPAGIACAIQLKRFGIYPYIIEKNKIGGLAQNAHLIENYPGFPAGISGSKFVESLNKQAKKSGIVVRSGNVKKINYKNNIFEIKIDNNVIYSNILVVASGTVPKKINIKGLAKIPASKIYYEIAPIINLLRNKEVAIIGSGDVSFDYSLSLGKYNNVVIIYRKKGPSCLQILNERIKKNKIFCYKNTKLLRVEKNSNKIILECMANDKKFNVSSDYLVVAIGRKPNTGFIPEDLKRKKTKNLYFIGDAAHIEKRQIGIAVGDGITAAMEIRKRMQSVEC